MTGKDLLEAMNEIEDCYVERAETGTIRKNRVWVNLTAMAACLCLLVAAFRIIPTNNQKLAAPEAAMAAETAAGADAAICEEAPMPESAEIMAANSAEAPAAEDSAVWQEAPGLTLLWQGNSWEIPYSSCSWTYQNDDGTDTGFEACGSHPLDNTLYLTVLEAKGRISLAFAEAPDAVNMVCWNGSDLGNTDAEPTAVAVEDDSFIPVNGDHIYEITACWEHEPFYGGSASYRFRITTEDNQ